jgi:hypothetical protein
MTTTEPRPTTDCTDCTDCTHCAQRAAEANDPYVLLTQARERIEGAARYRARTEKAGGDAFADLAKAGGLYVPDTEEW